MQAIVVSLLGVRRAPPSVELQIFLQWFIFSNSIWAISLFVFLSCAHHFVSIVIAFHSCASLVHSDFLLINKLICFVLFPAIDIVDVDRTWSSCITSIELSVIIIWNTFSIYDIIRCTIWLHLWFIGAWTLSNADCFRSCDSNEPTSGVLFQRITASQINAYDFQFHASIRRGRLHLTRSLYLLCVENRFRLHMIKWHTLSSSSHPFLTLPTKKNTDCQINLIRCVGWGRQYDVIKLNVYYNFANNIVERMVAAAGTPTPKNYYFFLCVQCQTYRILSACDAETEMIYEFTNIYYFESNKNVIFGNGNHFTAMPNNIVFSQSL